MERAALFWLAPLFSLATSLILAPVITTWHPCSVNHGKNISQMVGVGTRLHHNIMHLSILAKV